MKTIIIDGAEYKLTPIPKEKTYSDWRLPTVKELLTLVEYTKYNPSCDLEDTINNYYWSATTYAPNADGAWSVGFAYGSNSANYKPDSYYVRCVRDGENGLEWSKTSKEEMSWYEAIEYAKNLEAEVYYKGE